VFIVAKEEIGEWRKLAGNGDWEGDRARGEGATWRRETWRRETKRRETKRRRD
jgi:hypothetical protein